MSRFDVHWCDVAPQKAPGLAAPHCTLLALWPAPVHPDACFEEAGFTDFGDNDNDWDDQAHELLRRLVAELSRYGEPRAVNPAPPPRSPWWRRFLAEPPTHRPLLQQLELPTQWDSLPRCLVEFGQAGAALRTGNGHVLFWITLPTLDSSQVAAFVGAVSAHHPVVRTPLRWRTLRVAA